MSKIKNYIAEKEEQEEQKYEVYTYEHKGYLLQQTSYNWHYMIIDLSTNKMVMHCQCSKKLTEDTAKESIEFYLKIREGEKVNDCI